MFPSTLEYLISKHIVLLCFPLSLHLMHWQELGRTHRYFVLMRYLAGLYWLSQCRSPDVSRGSEAGFILGDLQDKT